SEKIISSPCPISASTFSNSGDINGEIVFSISHSLNKFGFSLRPEIAVLIAHLGSGLFRAGKFAYAIPAEHGGPGDGGFRVIQHLNRYIKQIGFDLIPQRVAA